MSVVIEGLRLESDNTLSFGNYSTREKQKVDGFEVGGDVYKVKTHDGITRLEKNAMLLFESVPGSAVHHFKMNEKAVAFAISGFEDTQITLELEPETEYKILIDQVNVGSMKSHFSGKVNFSIELKDALQNVVVEKV